MSILVVLVVTCAAGFPGASRSCELGIERVVGYSLRADRYAIRAEGDDGVRYVLRSLSTSEPLEEVDCDGSGHCQLTDALGLRACSYARLETLKATHGLAMARDPSIEGRWVLSRDGKPDRISLLDITSTGELEVRAVHVVGAEALVVVQERPADLCPSSRERILTVPEFDLRPGKRRTTTDSRLIDWSAVVAEDEPLVVRRAARARPMSAVVLADAARTAIASGMEHLATCWIEHGVGAMSERERELLLQRLAADPGLAHLADLAIKRSQPVHGASQRAANERPRSR